jgi:predicted HTH domain antitoxin
MKLDEPIWQPGPAGPMMSLGMGVGAMTVLPVPVPESLFASLRRAPHEVAGEMLLAATIHWYQQGSISMERAAETVGLSRAGFLAELARRKIDVFELDMADLARDVARD